jgi:hypothetical protein
MSRHLFDPRTFSAWRLSARKADVSISMDSVAISPRASSKFFLSLSKRFPFVSFDLPADGISRKERLLVFGALR